jgi:hypothetical protein
MHADGRGQHRHVAGERLEHGQPEPLGLRGHHHRVRRVDPQRDLARLDGAERQQRRVAGDLAGAVGALAASSRVGREEDVAPAGVEAEPLARCPAVQRPEAPGVDAAGQDRAPVPARRRRQLGRELGADGGDEVHAAQDRARDPAGARVAHVGPVQRDRPSRPADGQRRPGGEAEVGVDDVEPGAAVTPSQPRGRARVVAGREREDLEVDAGQRPQRGDLVAHEAPPRGGIGRRPHVRHDQCAHPRVILHSRGAVP